MEPRGGKNVGFRRRRGTGRERRKSKVWDQVGERLLAVDEEEEVEMGDRKMTVGSR